MRCFCHIWFAYALGCTENSYQINLHFSVALISYWEQPDGDEEPITETRMESVITFCLRKRIFY